jgi:hypothetical protein
VTISAAVRIVLEGFVVLVHWRHLLRERVVGRAARYAPVTHRASRFSWPRSSENV